MHLLSFNFLKIDRIIIDHRRYHPILPFLEHRRCLSAFPCYSFASTVYESFVVDCALVASFPTERRHISYVREISVPTFRTVFFFYRWLKIILELFLSFVPKYRIGRIQNRFFLFILRWRKQLVLGAEKNLTFLSKMTDKKKMLSISAFYIISLLA